MKTVDRSKWPAGPWDDEPDRVEWHDEATGLPCIARRSPLLGNWCGYVGIGPDHPLHGKSYHDSWDEDGNELVGGPFVDHLRVHYGITYAAECDHDFGVCHVSKPDEPDNLWWLGFDCAHGDDKSPANDFTFPGDTRQYRDLTYVKAQCESLAKQLAEIGSR